MRRQLKLWLVVLGLCLGLAGGLAIPLTAHAATSRRVLIVYDAINPTANGQQKLAAVQRILASLNLPTQTERLSDYQAGQLTDKAYQGVVTLNNWPQGRLTNAAFLRDRRQFTGRQLHIGSGLDAQEARQFGARRETLYHSNLSCGTGRIGNSCRSART
ncbi:hypothetical protein [Levilactobacillus namurensis]|uniref:Uncharacterized protein n=1 Tax=Levilactobacillus namurensis TaxID=380393 RepID=A0AAW8W9M9_9LACO|nr:hypothetical protein [Levilactobacillus namurensis]MDT7015073.1 hypothetical protein [Levilactobacillus namurensis]